MAVTIPQPQETRAGAAPGAQKERALWGGPPRQKLQPSVEVCSLLGQAEGENTLSLFSSPPRSSSRAPCWLSSPEAGGQGVCGPARQRTGCPHLVYSGSECTSGRTGVFLRDCSLPRASASTAASKLLGLQTRGDDVSVRSLHEVPPAF